MAHAIVQLRGGLGNQLFQFSLGERLRAHGYTVSFNEYPLLHSGSMDTKRHFALQPLVLKIVRLSPLALLRRRYLSNPRYKVYGDFPHFSDHALPSGNVIANGYWQHPAYAEAAKDAIRSALPKLKQAPSRNSIAIGVRRGDYVTNPVASEYHGALPVSYYRDALELLPKELPIEICTFEPEWVMTELIPQLGIASRASIMPEMPDWDRISYMSHSSYHIVANSTFHWWGAFLSQDPVAIVAPARWTARLATRCGIIPSEWKVI